MMFNVGIKCGFLLVCLLPASTESHLTGNLTQKKNLQRHLLSATTVVYTRCEGRLQNKSIKSHTVHRHDFELRLAWNILECAKSAMVDLNWSIPSAQGAPAHHFLCTLLPIDGTRSQQTIHFVSMKPLNWLRHRSLAPRGYKMAAVVEMEVPQLTSTLFLGIKTAIFILLLAWAKKKKKKSECFGGTRVPELRASNCERAAKRCLIKNHKQPTLCWLKCPQNFMRYAT